MADAKEKKVKLTAQQPILHDGEKVMPGQEFEADAKQAIDHIRNKTAGKK